MIRKPVPSEIAVDVAEPLAFTDEWLGKAGGGRDGAHGISHAVKWSRGPSTLDRGMEIHKNYQNSPFH